MAKAKPGGPKADIGGRYLYAALHPAGARNEQMCRFAGGSLAGQPLIRVTYALAGQAFLMKSMACRLLSITRGNSSCRDAEMAIVLRS
jgi:hypothetical protein